MDFLKLLHGFVKVVTWISCPLPNKTKLKFGQEFKTCWSFYLNWRCWMSQSNQCLGPFCLWQCFIFYWFVFTFFQLCHCNSVYQYNGPTLSKQWGLFKVCRTQFNMDINEPLSIQNPPRKPDSRLESWKSESGNDFADLWQLLTFISVFIFQTRSAAAIMCSPSYQ